MYFWEILILGSCLMKVCLFNLIKNAYYIKCNGVEIDNWTLVILGGIPPVIRLSNDPKMVVYVLDDIVEYYLDGLALAKDVEGKHLNFQFKIDNISNVLTMPNCMRD